MASLKTTKKELLSVFPRQMQNLELIIQENSDKLLTVIYFQKNIPDKHSNQEELNIWMKKIKNKEKGKELKKYQKHIDDIYKFCREEIIKENITEKDTALLYISLEDITNDSKNIVSINMIKRNMLNEDIKGVGKEFYKNLIKWLLNREYQYLTLIPLGKKLKKYWENLGQIQNKYANASTRRDFPEKKYFTHYQKL